MVRRAKFADGTPKPLPKPERNFQDKLKTLKNMSKGISPESRIRLLDYFIQEALTKGQLTEEQASGIYNKLREDKDKIKKQIDDLIQQIPFDYLMLNLCHHRHDLLLNKVVILIYQHI